MGVEGQTNLLAGSDSVAELAHDSGGVDEAYLKWRQGLLSITAGNQHLNLPFLGDIPMPGYYLTFIVQLT